MFQRHPGLDAKGASQMRDSRVRGDDKVAALHDRRRIQKGVWPRVKVRAQSLHAHARRQVLKLRLARSLLKADQAKAGDLREVKKMVNGEGAANINIAGVSLPTNRDPESFEPDPALPLFDPLFLRMKISSARGHIPQIGAEDERQAHQGYMKIKFRGHDPFVQDFACSVKLAHQSP